MNRPDQPLSPETLDELLSADLDGELERAAAELGFTVETARAALNASPDVAARRDALVRARDLLATQPPALAPEDAARLVTAALARADDARPTPQRVAHASTHRFRTARRALVGIATAAAVIAGVVALSANNPGGKSSSSVAANSAGATTAPALGAPEHAAPRPVAFGEVTPPGAFRLKVRAELAQQQVHQPSASAADKSAQSPTDLPAPDYGASDGTTTRNAAAGGAPATSGRRGCIAALARAGGVPSSPVLSGSGTKGTEPVYVVVYWQRATYLVYVLSAADCSVVSRTTLP